MLLTYFRDKKPTDLGNVIPKRSFLAKNPNNKCRRFACGGETGRRDVWMLQDKNKNA